MTRRLIDISVPLQNDVAADPPGAGPRIEYVDHQQSLPRLLPFFPGLKAEDLPDGQGWAVAEHAQRHASRCAVALSSDDERGRALLDDR